MEQESQGWAWIQKNLRKDGPDVSQRRRPEGGCCKGLGGVGVGSAVGDVSLAPEGQRACSSCWYVHLAQPCQHRQLRASLREDLEVRACPVPECPKSRGGNMAAGVATAMACGGRKDAPRVGRSPR
eukprot:748727-Hanusia_phi.AAC.8